MFERSKLRFEKLTREFLCELGRRMPDKVRYFIWRQEGRVIAFSLCMVEGDDLYAEYLGLDYTLALKLHLYHYAFRDVVTWAIANGYKNFRSSGLNYDPKLHLRSRLDPIDLYVRHTSPWAERPAGADPAGPGADPYRPDPAAVPQLQRGVGAGLAAAGPSAGELDPAVDRLGNSDNIATEVMPSPTITPPSNALWTSLRRRSKLSPNLPKWEQMHDEPCAIVAVDYGDIGRLPAMRADDAHQIG